MGNYLRTVNRNTFKKCDRSGLALGMTACCFSVSPVSRSISNSRLMTEYACAGVKAPCFISVLLHHNSKKSVCCFSFYFVRFCFVVVFFVLLLFFDRIVSTITALGIRNISHL